MNLQDFVTKCYVLVKKKLCSLTICQRNKTLDSFPPSAFSSQSQPVESVGNISQNRVSRTSTVCQSHSVQRAGPANEMV